MNQNWKLKCAYCIFEISHCEKKLWCHKPFSTATSLNLWCHILLTSAPCQIKAQAHFQNMGPFLSENSHKQHLLKNNQTIFNSSLHSALKSCKTISHIFFSFISSTFIGFATLCRSCFSCFSCFSSSFFLFSK